MTHLADCGKKGEKRGKRMNDLISRQAALDAMETWDKFGCDPDGKLVRYDDDKHYIPYVHYEDMVHVIKHLPSAQPEPAIPLQWIEAQIEWLKSLDNAFSTLTAGQISAMVNKWEDEQDE